MAEDHDVRTLTDPAELRAAAELFRHTLHVGPMPDAAWERHGPADDEHTLGVFTTGGELAGTAYSFPSRLTVPGGARIPAAAVSGVGVRADRTREGRLGALMWAQLSAAAGRGDAAAMLRASETAIYERYGYGIASRSDEVAVRAHPQWRPEAPGGGTVRMVGADDELGPVAALHERLAGQRPGAITRTRRWWRRVATPAEGADAYRGAAVHLPTGSERIDDGCLDDADGLVAWGLTEAHRPGRRDTLLVHDLWGATPSVVTALWRFVTGIDLIEGVVARHRPRDENLDLVLADPRAVTVTSGGRDELWLRILDVPAALAARTWAPDGEIVLRVHDPLFDDRSGTWRLGPDGPSPAAGAVPDLETGVAALAMAYLGDRTPSELVAAGRWAEHTDGAARCADALFGVPGPVPWCGTMF
ncbi:GNAT family N-acetyltransferase [Pseudonocardia phyllosphaerae]|uniref:GNAT family N-acetyltransferase n=1 Tax=Pseudonocardia phyllosphaerae TaxID=3390502 RepID=UPI00397E68E3